MADKEHEWSPASLDWNPVRHWGPGPKLPPGTGPFVRTFHFW